MLLISVNVVISFFLVINVLMCVSYHVWVHSTVKDGSIKDLIRVPWALYESSGIM